MCTLAKSGNIFYLTLTGDDDHRLNPSLLRSILSALSEIKSQSHPGSVLITTSHGRFFSNGFDLAWAQSAGSPSAAVRRLIDSLTRIISALLSLPMPTVAAVRGHAAAGGMILALCHDYVLMRRDGGVLYMSEVDLGLPIPEVLVAVVRAKIGAAAARRDVALRGAKIRGEEAVRRGIVESAHDSGEEVVEAAVRLAERLGKRKWDGGVYAEIRKSLYSELCAVLGLGSKTEPSQSSRL